MQGDAPRRLAASRARWLTVGRRALFGLGWALAAHHGWLLARRLVDASILEPLVLLRWAGAVFLVALAADLRRRGFSLCRGRAPVVLGLLALLLHVGVPAPAPEGVDLLLVVPLGLAAGLGSAALAVLAGRRRPRSLDLPPPRRRDDARRPLRERLGALPARFSPRPPPLPCPAV